MPGLMVAEKISQADVQSRLEAEAARFNASACGTHVYHQIWETEFQDGCNWTTTFEARDSSLPLSEMRGALERVQYQLSIVSFSD
jgi:hypothetical protein